MTAVIDGFLTPPLLVLLMLALSNRTVMRKFLNGPLLKTVGWATTAVMTAAVAGLTLTWEL